MLATVHAGSRMRGVTEDYIAFANTTLEGRLVTIDAAVISNTAWSGFISKWKELKLK